jgi:hypothetical protein
VNAQPALPTSRFLHTPWEQYSSLWLQLLYSETIPAAVRRGPWDQRSPVCFMAYVPSMQQTVCSGQGPQQAIKPLRVKHQVAVCRHYDVRVALVQCSLQHVYGILCPIPNQN